MTAGDGVSSTIFWWRRCSVQSRSPQRHARCRACRPSAAPRRGAGRRGTSRRRRPGRRSTTAPSRCAASSARSASSGAAHDLQALAAAAGRGLERDRPAVLPRRARRTRGRIVDALGRARHDRHAGGEHRARARRILAPIASIASGGGPIQTMPASAQRARERRVLGQEAVARVDRVGARACGPPRARGRRSGSDSAGGARAEQVGVVGAAHVRRVAVGLGVDGDAARCRARARRGTRAARSRRGWRPGPAERGHSNASSAPARRHALTYAAAGERAVLGQRLLDGRDQRPRPRPAPAPA